MGKKTTIVSVRLSPREIEILDRLHRRIIRNPYYYNKGRSCILRYGLDVLDSLSDEHFDNVVRYGGRTAMSELKLNQ